MLSKAQESTGASFEGCTMIKTISLEEAVGTQLAHRYYRIRPGEFKGPPFRKGHTVCDEDVCRLQRLGKNHLYLIDLKRMKFTKMKLRRCWPGLWPCGHCLGEQPQGREDQSAGGLGRPAPGRRSGFVRL